MAPQNVNNTNGRPRGRPRGRGRGRGGKTNQFKAATSNYTLDDLKEKRRRSASLDSGKSFGTEALVTNSPAKRPAPSVSDSEDLEILMDTPRNSIAVSTAEEANEETLIDNIGSQGNSKNCLGSGNLVNSDAPICSEKNASSSGSPPPPLPPLRDKKIPPPDHTNTNILLQQMLNRFEKVEDKLKKLDTMEIQLTKLDVIEGNSVKLNGVVQGIKSSLSNLHGDVETVKREAEANKKKFESEISTLKSTLEAQEAKFQSWAENITGEIENRVAAKTQLHFNRFTHHLESAFIKEQASNRKPSLIFSGIQEDDQSSDLAKIRDICNTYLGVSRLAIVTAYRLGTKKPSSSKPRPILVRFSLPKDRNRVWRAKKKLQQGQGSNIWIQEDMPRALREDLSVLLKVAKHASSLQKEEYNSITVKDFRLHFKGRSYSPAELELLPYELRPSSL